MNMQEIPNLLPSLSDWNAAMGEDDFGGPLFPPGADSDAKKRSHLRDLRPKTEPPFSAIRARLEAAFAAIDLSVDQPPDGEIPPTRHPNDWWEL